MAMLAGRAQAPHKLQGYRSQRNGGGGREDGYPSSYGSPTESDFSDAFVSHDDVTNWDEAQVGDWLRSIGAERYIENFKKHNITGDVLVDIDQAALRDMGVKKIGDRVRINAQIKMFRHQDYRSKRKSNRDSFAALDSSVQPHLSPIATSSSPRSSKVAVSSPQYLRPQDRALERPQSPLRHPNKYASGVSTASTAKRIETPQTARFAGTPQTGRFPTSKFASDPSTSTSSPLPIDKPYVRVIYENGSTSTMTIEGLQTGEEVILKALKNGKLNESMVKSHCFYVLVGIDADSNYCRKLHDYEILNICKNHLGPDRERLMLRRIHMGNPEGLQLITAGKVATAQAQRMPLSVHKDQATRSHAKIQQIMGESLPAITYPLSPASAARRQEHMEAVALGLERPSETIIERPPPRRREKTKELQLRPPSELVVADPVSYFPDADREEIERIRRMSMRRSARLSRATNRLSVASNFSVSSRGLEDAPPLPTIADHWLKDNNTVRARPLSILRMARPISSYRDSIASSTLGPLDEENSPSIEENRKSYVSMASESAPDSATVSITNPDGHSISHSSFDDYSPSHTEGGSFNEAIAQALAEDGEEPDEELNEFLKNDTYDDIKYIRGKLIGQGSFGSVYLALHAFTAELMAVKQVELPSTAGNAVDAKKNNMVEALKREIALLRELKHQHIVQYLGSSSEENHLNIFLEYIPGGSIAKMLVDFGNFNEDLCSKFVRQILIGLAFLHSKDIIHRDIKGANVLVDNHGMVKISDFGISKRVQDSKTLLESSTNDDSTANSSTGVGRRRVAAGLAQNRVSLQGSVFWMAPEVVRQTAYTRKADIWSLGCLVVEMLTGKHPHPNCTQLQAIFKIGGKSPDRSPSPDIPDDATPAAKDFLKATFRVEHEARPEAKQLLNTKWLDVN